MFKARRKRKAKRFFALFFASLFILCFACGIAALCINKAVVDATADNIISPDQAALLEGVDCVLVLGCLVRDNGVPSDMLYDRIRMGVELYNGGAAPKIIMSGDHGRTDYDEVDAMKKTAIEMGVPSADIFKDHAGFSTYESVYRAKEIFGADKIIIVSQEYHLYRALYIAEKLGIEVYGVASDYRTYYGQLSREIREVLARNKDVLSCLFKAKPTYLGEKIPLGASGDITEG